MTQSARDQIEAALDRKQWALMYHTRDNIGIYKHDSGLTIYAEYNDHGALWGIDYAVGGNITHVPRQGAIEQILWKIGELNGLHE